MFKKVYDEPNNFFGMSPKLREYSFLNRWFIYRRRSYGPLSVALVGAGGQPVAPPVTIELPVAPPVAGTRGGRGGRGGATRGRGRGGATRGAKA